VSMDSNEALDPDLLRTICAAPRGVDSCSPAVFDRDISSGTLLVLES